MICRGRLSWESVGLAVGPISFAVLFFGNPIGLDQAATAVLASTTWIVVWWVTEAIPIPATSLLPVILFPITDVTTVTGATSPYADPIVFLLLGGFVLALAIERWNLHHRLSLLILSTVGTSGKALVFGFMIATGFLSMWISNTATAMMMVPIGAAVIVELTAVGGRRKPPLDRDDILEPNEPDDVTGEIVHHLEAGPIELPNTSFGLALMFGIAYGASIGGAATLIGSPPNAVLAGVAETNLGVEIGFLEWMLVGVPLAAVFLVITWGMLVLVLRPTVDKQPGREDVIDEQLTELGPITTGETRVLGVLLLVAGAWILRPFVIEPVFPMVTDAMIAIAGAVLVFVVPVGDERLLDWEYTTRVPWGVLLLLGAGFSIARAFQVSELDAVIADAIADVGVTSLLGMILLVATVVIGGAGAIPRRLRRGYAPSLRETVHRLHHCWIFHSVKNQ